MNADPGDAADVLHRALELHPRAAIRPEDFGALVYHYDNRRLMFIKHPDVVRVVRCLAQYRDGTAALIGCGVDVERHAQFARALQTLLDSEVIRERDA